MRVERVCQVCDGCGPWPHKTPGRSTISSWLQALYMTERFQTFFTRLRPHRVAVLINVDDDTWQSTCMSIVEYLSQIWGGYHSLIVPTDGKSIDLLFWKLLSAFDPDIIVFYRRTLRDLERISPAVLEQRVATEIQKAKDGLDTEGAESSLRNQILSWPLDGFTISPDLARTLLLRLSPFHYQDHYQITPIGVGQAPARTLTKVSDVVPFVEAPDSMGVLTNNLPPDREAPPPLWLHSGSGLATAAFQADMQSAGVTTVPVFMNVLADEEIMKWGVQPWVSFRQNAPFSFAQISLASVRAVGPARLTVPSVLVAGDTLKDFCLYYALSRLHNRAAWLPSWFKPKEPRFASRLVHVVRDLEEMGHQEHSDTIAVLSTSVPDGEINDLIATIRRYLPTSSFTPDDGNDPMFLDRMLWQPSKWYIRKNLDQITTHQIVDDKLPGYFESPVPSAFSEIIASKHRWLVEIAFAGNQMPRHPVLGRHLASGPNIGPVRAGIDGLTYQCPGTYTVGDDIELQMLRLNISVPRPEKIFSIILAASGYECSLSDKGRYENETIEKFGSLENAASALRHPTLSGLLKEFLNMQRPSQGVFDEGVFLGDKRRYLNFDRILALVNDATVAYTTIDDWISRKIFYRGVVLKCARCADVAWHSIADITERFTCLRCGTNQQYIHESWRHPDEPSWFYKLDEMVYQTLRHHGDATLLTLDALRRQTPMSFQFCPELTLTPKGASGPIMEIDVCCVMQGSIVIGEAKSIDTLAEPNISAIKAATKYALLAERMGATGLVFSTAAAAWNARTTQALGALKNSHPYLRHYRYTAVNLQ